MTFLCCRFATEIFTAEVLTLLGLFSFLCFLPLFLFFIVPFASTVARLKVLPLIPGRQEFGGSESVNLTGSDH